MFSDDILALINQGEEGNNYSLQDGGQPAGFLCIRHDSFGVVIPTNEPLTQGYHEHSENLVFESEHIGNSAQLNGLGFFCKNQALAKVFSVLAADFCCIQNRNAILQNPLAWWNALTLAMGNKLKEDSYASVFAELLSLIFLKSKNKNVRWNPDKNLHDIQELENEGKQYEVKSSLIRNMRVIEISSKFQQRSIDELFYCQLAPQEDGYNIEDLLRIADNLHCDMASIRDVLLKKGYDSREHAWKQKYQILNFAVFFPKCQGFPAIDINDHHILTATYTILLDNLPEAMSMELTSQVKNLLS